MKKLIIFIVACIFANVALGQTQVINNNKTDRAIALGQGAFAGTTQEEYNYITKGYKIQIESGLDMKKGYRFVDMGKSITTTWNRPVELRECSFMGLVRDGQTKPCAIMMIYKRTDIPNSAVYYICIPSDNAPEEIWQQTMTFITKTFSGVNDIPMMQAVIWALMHFGSREAGR